MSRMETKERSKKQLAVVAWIAFYFWAMMVITLALGMLSPQSSALGGRMAAGFVGGAGALMAWRSLTTRHEKGAGRLGISGIINCGLALATINGGFIFPILAVIQTYFLGMKKSSQGVDSDVQDDVKIVRGTRVEDSRNKKKKSDADLLEIGGVPISQDVEASHFLLAGGPGTGKSVAIDGMLNVIRNRNQRAIVYDPTGEFLARYYRPGDTILNPLDGRCEAWTPWADAYSIPDYERMAEAMVPENLDQPFWHQSGRALLTSILAEAKTVDEMIHLVMASENEELLEVVKKHGMLGMVGSMQTFSNSRASMTAPTTSLRYLRDPKAGQKAFSIRNWVQRDESSWLFLTSRADQQSVLRPLISLFVDLAVMSTMLLPPSRTRRVWFYLDELASLQKLPALQVGMAQGRKFGLSCVLGIQSIAQLTDIYGRAGGETILGLPQSQLLLRLPDPDTADWASRAIGQRHVIRAVESESSNSSGGGSSTNMQHNTEAAVLASQIQNLPKLQGYLRLPGENVKLVRLTPMDRPDVAKPYVPVPANEAGKFQPTTTPPATALGGLGDDI